MVIYLPVLRTVWGGYTGMIGVKIKENKEISCANHEDISSVLETYIRTFMTRKYLTAQVSSENVVESKFYQKCMLISDLSRTSMILPHYVFENLLFCKILYVEFIKS